MFETLKQSIFTSLGVASLAKDKVKALAAELPRRAQLTRKQFWHFCAQVRPLLRYRSRIREV